MSLRCIAEVLRRQSLLRDAEGGMVRPNYQTNNFVRGGAPENLTDRDSTVMSPRQETTIRARDCVGWLSFSMGGKFAYSSTSEIIDVATKKVIASLRDENGQDVQSEKVLDVIIRSGRVIAAGNQFGVGQKRRLSRLRIPVRVKQFSP